MAFTTKQALIDAKFFQPLNGALDLSGATYVNKAEYLTGMTGAYNLNTLTSVKFVTGQTANLQADIDYISGKTKSNYEKFTGYTGTTELRLQGIEGDIDFISGVTDANTADISALAAVSGLTTQAITGVTNGLTKVGDHSARLGGLLTQPTVFTGSTVNHLKYNGDYSAGFGLQSIPDYQSIVTMKSSAITSNFTLTLPMLGEALIVTKATEAIVTVPTNVSVAFPIGSTITIQQGGVGTVTVSGATSGVTLTGVALSTTQQYGFIQLWKTGTNAWTVIGGALELWEAVGNILSPVDTNQRVPAIYISGLTTVLTGYTNGATNGLYVTGQKVHLGGALTGDTTISGAAGAYDLSFTNLDSFNVGFDNVSTITDSGANGGLRYANNYSGSYVGRSIPDVVYVTGKTNALCQNINYYTGTTAPATFAKRCDIVYYTGTTAPAEYVSRSCYNQYTGYTQPIINNAFTGVTNGLTEVDAHNIKLGGALSETTDIYGSEILNINVDSLNLSGVTNGIRLSGTTYISKPSTGVGDVLTWNASTGAIEKTTMASLGGLTGATNGLGTNGQNACLGGALSANTSICGGGALDLCLGTSASKLDELRIFAKTCVGVVTGDLGITSSGATFTDARPSASRAGIVYGADYQTSFIDESLVTKRYVDTVATGLQVHAAVVVTTTGSNIALNSGTTTLDGLTLVHGWRVLVRNQTSGATNGIYIVNTGGTWSRSTDYNFNPPTEIANGDLIPVITGSTLNNTLWALVTPDPIVSGDSLNFTLFSQTIDVIASSGITVQMNGGVHNVAINLATNSGLCLTPSQLCVGAGNGLSATGHTLNVNACSYGGSSAIRVAYNGGDCLVVTCSDILGVMAGTGALTGATNGLGTTSSNKVCLGGTLISGTTITGNYAAGCGLTYTDAAITNKRGILYGGDYDATFLPLSLVTKGFVTGCTAVANAIAAVAITGASNGLTKSGNHDVHLGGSLICSTIIDTTTGFTFIINGAPGYAFIEMADFSNCWSTGHHVALNSCCSTDVLGRCTVGIGIANLGGTVITNDLYIGFKKKGVVTDSNVTPSGLTYASSAYRNTFVDTSLVDKGYVDLAIQAFSGTTFVNGLTKTAQAVCLGGTLCEPTTIIDTATLILQIADGGVGGLYVCGANADVIIGDSTLAGPFICTTIATIGIQGNGQPVTVCSDTNSVSICSDNTGGAGTGVLISNDGGGGGMLDLNATCNLFTDSNNLKGLEYAGDYATQFTACSLPDVKFVTGCTAAAASAVGADNGLTKYSGNIIGLGGILTGSTTIDTSTFNLVICDSNAIGRLQILNTDITVLETSGGAYACVDGAQDLVQVTTVGGTCDSFKVDTAGLAYFCVDGVQDRIFAATNGSSALFIDGLTDCINLCNSGARVELTGSSVILAGAVCLITSPNPGSTSDSVLVRAGNGEIKTVSGAELGDKNNIYSYTAVTSNATLETGTTYVVYTDSTGGGFTVTLPDPPLTGQVFKIKDCAAAAMVENVVIDSGVGYTIDGSQCALINSDYGALEVHYAGSSKWFTLGMVI